MNGLCSHERLELALAGSLNADEESTLHLHLEDCELCSAEMERLAGGESASREIAAMLMPDDLDDALPLREECSTADFVVDHLEPSDDPEVLGRLGGYDVLDIIGRGGMGVVLKGFDRELKRFVAIKALAPHLAHCALARKRFAREAQAAAAVVNLHVIAIHQVQPNGQLPFLVMPLLTGESLAQRLKARGTLELKEILRIGMQAAEGLAAAHGQGLIHRDVKPANILLEKGVERAVLTDFGLARAADDVSMTRWGIIAGTPEYMSPEQARGEALDGRSDLFSLGCVLYEMATGVSPFRTDSTLATLRRIVDEQPAAMASLVPELPPWFCHIVERLLSKDPAQRFASASEVSQLLEQCLSHLQQPTSVTLPASLVPHAAGRRSIFNVPRKGMIAMLGTIGMTLLGMVLMQATEAPDISGQWTSDEWGTVVLEAKGSGEYEGTFGGNNKTGKPATGKAIPAGAGAAPFQDKLAELNAKIAALKAERAKSSESYASKHPKIRKLDAEVEAFEEARASFILTNPQAISAKPAEESEGLPGSDEGQPAAGATKPPGSDRGGSSSEILPGSPGASGIPSGFNKGKTGTLQLKWSRLERRFNGTWGKDAGRCGTMSLRMVDQDIRGGFTTDEDVQLETGTPLVGDLLWKRSVVTVPDGGKVLLRNPKRTSEPTNDSIRETLSQTSQRSVSFRAIMFDIDAELSTEFPVGTMHHLGLKTFGDNYKQLIEEGRMTVVSRPNIRTQIGETSIVQIGMSMIARSPDKGEMMDRIVGETLQMTPREVDGELVLDIQFTSERPLKDVAQPATDVPLQSNTYSFRVPLKKYEGNGVMLGPFALPNRILRCIHLVKVDNDVEHQDASLNAANVSEIEKPLEAGTPLVGDLLWKRSQETDGDSLLKKPGKQIGTVLGKPVYEIDLNPNDSTEDNFGRLFLQPLIQDYCQRHKLDRADELKARIKDGNNRQIVSAFVVRWDFNRHLFEQHGGRVISGALGPVAFDGMRHWLEEQQQAGQIEVTDPKLKARLSELLTPFLPRGTSAEEPDEVKGLFDPAVMEEFIKRATDNRDTAVEPRTEGYRPAKAAWAETKTAVPSPSPWPKPNPSTIDRTDAARVPTPFVLDVQNARAVVEYVVRVMLSGDGHMPSNEIWPRNLDVKRLGMKLAGNLHGKRLAIRSVYVNDPAQPTKAMAMSEVVKLKVKPTNGQHDGFLVRMLLSMGERGWIVTDIVDIESEESAEAELKQFLKANPNAIGLPPQPNGNFNTAPAATEE